MNTNQQNLRRVRRRLTSKERWGNSGGGAGILAKPPRRLSGQNSELLVAMWSIPRVQFSRRYRSFTGVWTTETLQNHVNPDGLQHNKLHSPYGWGCSAPDPSSECPCPRRSPATAP